MLKDSKKFAIFLCNFTDSINPQPKSKEDYENVFFHAEDSINQYWLDNSKGNLNINGSEIFGWNTLPFKRNEFLEKIKKSEGSSVRSLALQVMQRELKVEDKENKYHYNSDQFDYIIGIFAEQIGDEGSDGGRGIVGDNQRDDTHTFFCHEMAHALGFDHSYDFSDRETWGVKGVYYHWTDLMSANRVFKTSQKLLRFKGPNLCSVNRDLMGWIPKNRILSININNTTILEEIEIVSRSFSEKEGIELVKIDGFYIEFVSKDNWDLGIPRSGITISENINKKAYVVVKDNTKPDEQLWHEGMYYGSKPETISFPFTSVLGSRYFYIEILEINDISKKAKIRIEKGGRKNRIGEIGGTIIGGVKTGGGGYIIVGGKLKSIPPRNILSRIAFGLANMFTRISFNLIKSNSIDIGNDINITGK